MSEPTEETFRKLNALLPQYKKQAAKILTQRKLAQNGANQKPVPCPICGADFEKFKGIDKVSRKFCDKCQEFLDDGCCALVTVDGKRFAFSKPGKDFKYWDEWNQLCAGNVLGVSNEEMEEPSKTATVFFVRKLRERHEIQMDGDGK